MTDEPVVDPIACACRFSDAWRCAVARNLSNQITCSCSCHRRGSVAGLQGTPPMKCLDCEFAIRNGGTACLVHGPAAPAPPTSNERVCRGCEHSIPWDWVFCAWCGEENDRHHELCDVRDLNAEGIRKPCNCKGRTVETPAPLIAPACPQCGHLLERVRRSNDSMLNEEQFDAVRAGDWYCERCPSNGRGNTSFAYFWDREVRGAVKTAGDVPL